MTCNIGKRKLKSLDRVGKNKRIIFIMKTKEQESALLGLEEINDSQKNKIEGGSLYPFETNGSPYVYCCFDIPPAKDYLTDYLY